MHFLPSTLCQEKRHFNHKFCGESENTFSSKHELRLVNMIQCIQYYTYIVMYPYLSGITMWDECFFLYRAGRPLFVATPCIIRYSQIFCSLCQVTRLFAKRQYVTPQSTCCINIQPFAVEPTSFCAKCNNIQAFCHQLNGAKN